MNIKNFLSMGPPWVSNCLSAVFSLLILVDQLGPQIAELFGILNCQSCLTIFKQVLAVSGAVLAILKLFLKAKITLQINNPPKPKALPKPKNPPPAPQ